jgi:hypothetical protein
MNRAEYLESGIRDIASRLAADVDTVSAARSLMALVNHGSIRELATAELAAESFRDLVDREKERIRKHVPWWHRICPFEITVKRRKRNDD